MEVSRNKRKIVVDQPSPNKNSLVINPLTQTTSFGVFPEIDHPLYFFPQGDIIMHYGRHFAPGRGYGLSHIWTAHSRELIPLGYTTIMCGARYVAEILQPGAKIFCEFAEHKNERAGILRSPNGYLILEHRNGHNGGDDFYSIVTAYSRRNIQAEEIGVL